MKTNLLTLLQRGAKTEQELAVIYSVDKMPEVMALVKSLVAAGILGDYCRMVPEGNNMFHFEREYGLALEAVA